MRQLLLPFPVTERFPCLVCGHGSFNGTGTCENPGCAGNPANDRPEFWARLAEDQARREAEEARLAEKKRLQRAGFITAF